MAAPRKVDYERIEPGWRAGVKSAEQLAVEYTEETGVSVSGAAIKKHFRQQGIPRDLTAKVRAKADAKVLEASVEASKRSAKSAVIVEAAASEIAAIRLEHRADASRARRLVRKLLEELAAVSDRPDLIESMEQALAERGEKAPEALRQALNRVTSLPGSVGALKTLAEAMRTLITIEREAYSMDADGGGGGGGIGELARPLTDAERASRLASILERVRQRAQASDAGAGGDAAGS